MSNMLGQYTRNRSDVRGRYAAAYGQENYAECVKVWNDFISEDMFCDYFRAIQIEEVHVDVKFY